MQRNTLQRKRVMDVLTSLEGEHPSAERVYERVHTLFPTVSKATVYRILKDEAAHGTILGVDLPRRRTLRFAYGWALPHTLPRVRARFGYREG